MRRNWIKLYVDQTLRGSCFDELLPDERFVWFGFLLLAGDNAHEGKISITERIGYTNKQLAELLKCKKSLILRSIRKLLKVNKVKLYKNNVVKIVNWQKYQSEYQRQKPYREERLLSKVTIESDMTEREGDRDIERDKEKEILKKKNGLTKQEKRNYAIGMDKERENERLKKDLKKEREKEIKKPQEYYEALKCAKSKNYICTVSKKIKMCDICKKDKLTK